MLRVTQYSECLNGKKIITEIRRTQRIIKKKISSDKQRITKLSL